MRIYSILCLMSFGILSSMAFAQSADWADIEIGKNYVLNQSISFPGVIDFHPGENAEVTDLTVGGVPIIYFEVHFSDCKNPEFESEMILMNPNPEDAGNDRSIGLALEKNCTMGIWVEPKDIYTKSIFKIN
jgi:hypothetical protein